MWEQWPLHPLQVSARLFLLTQIALNLHLLTCHFFVDASDRIAMSLHHFVTCALLIGAFACNLTRVSILVLFCHDLCDVFL
ncbi:MAG: hypothetical protein MHM6MM_003589 [Cercozoa sp. M6MM]